MTASAVSHPSQAKRVNPVAIPRDDIEHHHDEQEQDITAPTYTSTSTRRETQLRSAARWRQNVTKQSTSESASNPDCANDHASAADQDGPEVLKEFSTMLSWPAATPCRFAKTANRRSVAARSAPGRIPHWHHFVLSDMRVGRFVGRDHARSRAHGERLSLAHDVLPANAPCGTRGYG